MDQDQLDKLVSILSNSGNGYRDSAVTEATQVWNIIVANRPDLYDHMRREAGREIAEPTETAMVRVGQELNISEVENSLENTVTMQDDDKIVVYRGSLIRLYWDFNKKTVGGEAKILKYLIQPVKKKKWKVFPPSITEVEIQRWKKVWEMSSMEHYNCVTFIKEGAVLLDYRKKLMEMAQSKGYLVPSSLLGAVFDPLDQRLLEIYNSI